jgi:histidinol-phosphate phosphatase family protein
VPVHASPRAARALLHPREIRSGGRAVTDDVRRDCPLAVLLDRDGTLCIDVPYNGDPSRVVPMPGALSALEALRHAGVATAVVSNQSGIARGLHTAAQTEAVNAQLDALIGPLGPFFYCPHLADAGCRCRKPRPGMVLDAAAALGVDAADCVVIGDIAADLGAAAAAGARAVLVPTEMTHPEEIDEARRTAAVAPDLLTAVSLILSGALPALRDAGTAGTAGRDAA